MLKIIYIITIILNLYLFYTIKRETDTKNLVCIINVILFIYLLIFN